MQWNKNLSMFLTFSNSVFEYVKDNQKDHSEWWYEAQDEAD